MFKQECADRGINRQLALKDAQGQNGVVERYLRTIQESRVASLVSSGAPQLLFFHAVLAFNFVDNRLLDESGTCKLERLLGLPVPQMRFYPFACKVVSVMPRAKQHIGKGLQQKTTFLLATLLITKEVISFSTLKRARL